MSARSALIKGSVIAACTGDLRSPGGATHTVYSPQTSTQPDEGDLDPATGTRPRVVNAHPPAMPSSVWVASATARTMSPTAAGRTSVGNGGHSPKSVSGSGFAETHSSNGAGQPA